MLRFCNQCTYSRNTLGDLGVLLVETSIVDEKYYIFNQTRQSFLHLGVSVADTSLRRLKGLVGKIFPSQR